VATTSAGTRSATGKQRKGFLANSAYTAAFGQGLVELDEGIHVWSPLRARCRVEREPRLREGVSARFFDVGSRSDTQ